MVTAKEGLMSSNLSSTANRVLVDYKDAIQDYKVTDMPVIVGQQVRSGDTLAAIG